MELAIFWLLFPIFSAILAHNKQRSALGWFFVGLLFGPFGLLVGLMSPLKEQQLSAQQAPHDEPAGKEDWLWSLIRFGTFLTIALLVYGRANDTPEMTGVALLFGLGCLGGAVALAVKQRPLSQSSIPSLYAPIPLQEDHDDPSPALATNHDISGRLSKLESLKTQGLITEEEYAERRQAILEEI